MSFGETTLKYESACCREPRGFGFVQYVDPDDAAEAKYEMDGRVLLGRELTVVFAEENRKRPSEMRSRERIRFDILATFSLLSTHTWLKSSPPWFFRSLLNRSSSRYSRSRSYSRSFSPRGRRYSRSACNSLEHSSTIRSWCSNQISVFIWMQVRFTSWPEVQRKVLLEVSEQEP